MRKITFFVILFCATVWIGTELKKDSVPDVGARPAFKNVSKTDRPASYFQFHRGIRTPDNSSSPRYERGYKWKELREAKQAAARRRSIGRTKSNGVLEWIERGPGNVPGRTRAVYNIPGDPNNNTWLAGSATGGIWRTSDGGSSWVEKSSDFPALPISAFAADVNANVIYAGTGEFMSSIFSAVGNGIFKSHDKGESWSQLPSTNNNPDFSIVTRLIVNPANGNEIIATTVPHNFEADNTSSIMRSTNGGTSWIKVKSITGIFEQVIATPGNFAIQYASENGEGVWKSTDAGVTWHRSNTGMAPTGRVEISVSPVNPNRLFAAAEGTLSGKQSDLYVSHNAGASWSLVNVVFENKTVDFFEGQGFYDNVILCDPFEANNVYFGGVSLFRSTLGAVSANVIDNWRILEHGTAGFIFLQSFEGIEWDHGRLTVDNSNPKMTVQLRFGPGMMQQAHRFFVPLGATDGVAVNQYTYQDYVSVPFEAWDVTDPATPRQLMVSFRDQNRNGFDLLPSQVEASVPADEQSREYVYIHSLTYHPVVPGASITVNGGQEKNMAYNIFPALAENAVWPASSMASVLEIKYTGIARYHANTIIAADGRGNFDNKNKANQVNLDQGVHPDHHTMVPIIINQAAKTFKLLLGNDGGVFISKVSANPGTLEGDWQFKGIGYNTSQFYGADKKPGKDQYIGGMQDNGTRMSPSTEDASAQSGYLYAIGGDGFEVLWNNKDENKILGSVYYAQISRTVNGGTTWESVGSGLGANEVDFPFVTKLANSKNFPDRVFTVGGKGVYVSNDFGKSWTLTPIAQNFILGSSFYLDVDVSRANANIVWAGSGMTNSGPLVRSLHVSTNGGATFSPTVNFPTVALGNITKLATHPKEENTAYAIFSFSKSPKILRTTNLGQSWEDISGFGNGTSSTNGFPDVAVYCLYVRPDNPDIIWAGTEIGIVESMDNGESWSLIEDFPNVSVWDMKGQDNQVVIATHGRGIWTAQMEAEQTGAETPAIVASGTSPTGDFVCRIESRENFDSIQVFVENNLAKTFYTITPGTLDVQLKNVSTGNRSVRLISYRGRVPFQSTGYVGRQISVLPRKNSYATYFNTLSDLHVNGLTLQHFAGGSSQRQTLQTNHNYSLNRSYEILLRTPVVVSGSLPILYYRDIAIVEPGNDSVIVEATRNGLDWISLAPAYDAMFDGDQTGSWENAFRNNRAGKAEMFIKHEINLHETFAEGDLLLFRFRFISGGAVTSWGWAIDYISIQETPIVPEHADTQPSLAVFPNPSPGGVTVDYTLEQPSDITFNLVDVYGRQVVTLVAGARKTGYNSEVLDLNSVHPGTYILILNSSEGKKTGKVTIAR